MHAPFAVTRQIKESDHCRGLQSVLRCLISTRWRESSQVRQFIDYLFKAALKPLALCEQTKFAKYCRLSCGGLGPIGACPGASDADDDLLVTHA